MDFAIFSAHNLKMESYYFHFSLSDSSDVFVSIIYFLLHLCAHFGARVTRQTRLALINRVQYLINSCKRKNKIGSQAYITIVGRSVIS